MVSIRNASNCDFFNYKKNDGVRDVNKRIGIGAKNFQCPRGEKLARGIEKLQIGLR